MQPPRSQIQTIRDMLGFPEEDREVRRRLDEDKRIAAAVLDGWIEGAATSPSLPDVAYDKFRPGVNAHPRASASG